MRKVLIGAVAVLLALSGAAWAADVEGKIKSVDAAEKSFMLEDGTKIWLGAGAAIETLTEGVEVKASYEEKDGKNIATSVEIK
jgi:hypothetical protein